MPACFLSPRVGALNSQPSLMNFCLARTYASRSAANFSASALPCSSFLAVTLAWDYLTDGTNWVDGICGQGARLERESLVRTARPASPAFWCA